MDPITLNMAGSSNITLLSNDFIDNYMKDANDVQIKLYLYLLRSISAGRSTDISELADFFNYPEKDIERALRYWENKGVISLGSGKKDIPDPGEIKNSYTIEMLKAFKRSSETSWLITALQQYTGRPVSPSQISSLLFMHKELSMSPALIDFLLQHCIEQGEDSIRGIEETALSWIEQGVQTVEEAKLFLNGNSDRQVKHILYLLGRSGQPAPMELRLINRWLSTYRFDDRLIEEACNRAVAAVSTNRIAYAESILKKWHEQGISTLEQVAAADENYRNACAFRSSAPAKRTAAGSSSASASDSARPSGTFCNIEQQDYDFEELAGKLVNNK